MIALLIHRSAESISSFVLVKANVYTAGVLLLLMERSDGTLFNYDRIAYEGALFYRCSFAANAHLDGYSMRVQIPSGIPHRAHIPSP
jgi:hypothetical protein